VERIFILGIGLNKVVSRKIMFNEEESARERRLSFYYDTPLDVPLEWPKLKLLE
jgi:hypothetical protein